MSAPPVTTATRPLSMASSQTGIRGQEVRQASIVSLYVRGRAATHARSSITSAVGAVNGLANDGTEVTGNPLVRKSTVASPRRKKKSVWTPAARPEYRGG